MYVTYTHFMLDLLHTLLELTLATLGDQILEVSRPIPLLGAQRLIVTLASSLNKLF